MRLCGVCVFPDRDVGFYLSPINSKANLLSQMFSFSIPFKAFYDGKARERIEPKNSGRSLVRDWPQKKSLRTRDLRDSIEIKRYLRDLNSFSLFLMRSLQYSIAV